MVGFVRGAAVESAPPTLDATQRAVVDLPDAASAAVLGAPGTGKTTTLVELVADRVLGRGWHPSEVLVLTPIRATATRLRDAIALRLARADHGTDGAHRQLPRVRDRRRRRARGRRGAAAPRDRWRAGCRHRGPARGPPRRRHRPRLAGEPRRRGARHPAVPHRAARAHDARDRVRRVAGRPARARAHARAAGVGGSRGLHRRVLPGGHGVARAAARPGRARAVRVGGDPQRASGRPGRGACGSSWSTTSRRRRRRRSRSCGRSRAAASA